MKSIIFVVLMAALGAEGADDLHRQGLFVGEGPGGSIRPRMGGEAAKAGSKATRGPATGIQSPVGQWRVVEGRTNMIDTTWQEMSAQVVSVMDGGLVCQSYSFSWRDLSYMSPHYGFTFFLTNYPAAATEDEKITFWAKETGTHTFERKVTGKHTVKKFDYGKPSGPPPEVVARQKEAQEAANAKKEAARLKTLPKLIAWEQDQASRGIASGQYALGMRYLKGDGVDQDEKLAREWIQKAAAQGHAQAKSALAKLPPVNP